MANWHDQRYTAHHHDHIRDYRKHEPRPGEPDFPIRLETAPITGALEVAILAQAVSLQQAADLIEQYARTKASEAQLDTAAEAYNRIDRVLTEAAGEKA